MKRKKKIGVVLSGGGARGAYQAGVLKGVCEIAHRLKLKFPFSIFSGISVGAINSALFASYAEDTQHACSKLIEVWEGLNTGKVIRTSTLELGKAAYRIILELTSGKMIKHKRARALLDNAPLLDLIEKEIDFSRIKKNIEEGHLKSLAVTAVNYTDGKNYIFFQTAQKVKPWVRERRVVKETAISKDHIMASSAIPLYFPPQKIGNHYFADGNIRNSTPLSPPIRLGAEKLLVISVKEKDIPADEHELFEPTFGRMVSVLLNALLLDAVDFDFERLSRINETLKFVPDSTKTPLKNIDVCLIRPSENIADLSQNMVSCMPKPLRHFLEGLGSAKETGGLISTLLFEPPFIAKLIELGLQDVKQREDEVAEFLLNH